MTICFRDEIGFIALTVDEYGIDFFGGEAVFSSNGKDYRIPVRDILTIGNGGSLNA